MQQLKAGRPGCCLRAQPTAAHPALRSRTRTIAATPGAAAPQPQGRADGAAQSVTAASQGVSFADYQGAAAAEAYLREQ
jgi:hypothetical protein